MKTKERSYEDPANIKGEATLNGKVVYILGYILHCYGEGSRERNSAGQWVYPTTEKELQMLVLMDNPDWPGMPFPEKVDITLLENIKEYGEIPNISENAERKHVPRRKKPKKKEAPRKHFRDVLEKAPALQAPELMPMTISWNVAQCFGPAKRF